MTDSRDGQVTLAVLSTKLDYLISKVDQMNGRTSKCEDRIERLEATMTVVKWLGGAAGTVLLALTIAWLRTVLGL